MKYNQTMSDALREVSEFSEGPEQLDEVSLLGLVRTGAITINTAKALQSGKKVQQHSRELRQVGAELKRDKTPEDGQKTIAEGFETLSKVLFHMEEMLRRNVYVSASGGLFSDRAYSVLKKMNQKRR